MDSWTLGRASFMPGSPPKRGWDRKGRVVIEITIEPSA